MKSHIDIEVNGCPLALPEDQSLEVTERNFLFHDIEMFSAPVELPFDGNRRVFKNMDDTRSELRAEDADNAPARILVDGLHYRTGVLHVQEDEVLDGRIAVNFDSRTKSFKDMIRDMKCRNVPVADKILIGEKIGPVHFVFSKVDVGFFGYLIDNGEGGSERIDTSARIIGSEENFDETFTPPAMGFSYPGKCSSQSTVFPAAASVKDYGNGITVNVPAVIDSYINVSVPYSGGAKYCNSRVCYVHHGYNSENGESTDDIVPAEEATYVNEDFSPYWVLPAERPASGICFYVAYFLECLFRHLGLAYDISALTDIEDFNYLAFFTTHCKYDEEDAGYDTLPDIDAINQWLSSRGCGGQIEFEIGKFTTKYKNIDTMPTCTEEYYQNAEYDYIHGGDYWDYVKRMAVIRSYSATAKVSKMYANSGNFPDASVSEVIDSLENSFGVRFYYDPEINKVTAFLLRDVFQSQASPIHLNGHVVSVHKMTEKITGVRMKYSSESDREEQLNNIRNGVRKYNTDYDYMEYPADRLVFKSYADIVRKIDVADMSVYINTTTGNAIRIKVDENATTIAEMKPAAFEVGQFKGIEVGDCSDENNEYVTEIVSNFQPLVVNDVNFRNGGTTNPLYQPLLVPFMDANMEHEFVEARLRNPFIVEDSEVYLTFVLRSMESYDPSSTDDGLSPLQSYDWGLSVGVLRTGDGGAGVENFDPNYDGFGNWRWRDIADNYCMSSDTMDQMGLWLGHTDQADTFSLKIRAYKPFLYYFDANQELHVTYDMSLVGQPADDGRYVWSIPCQDDERNSNGTITKRVKSRGLADVFMSEYIHFLLHRRKYKIKALVEIAQLADIPNRWGSRFEIDGLIGFINKMTYSVSAVNGVGEVDIEFFVI